MHKDLQPFEPWCGVWVGHAKTIEDEQVVLRLEIRPHLNGEALRLQIELTQIETGSLLHGVVAIMAASPAGTINAICVSTRTGPYLAELTPDDPDVLALAQFAPEGVVGSLILVEEAGSLLFTAHTRPADEPTDGPRSRSITASLHRQAPAQPGVSA